MVGLVYGVQWHFQQYFSYIVAVGTLMWIREQYNGNAIQSTHFTTEPIYKETYLHTIHHRAYLQGHLPELEKYKQRYNQQGNRQGKSNQRYVDM